MAKLDQSDADSHRAQREVQQGAREHGDEVKRARSIKPRKIEEVDS